MAKGTIRETRAQRRPAPGPSSQTAGTATGRARTKKPEAQAATPESDAPNGSVANEEEVYEALMSLGAPATSREDFSRLYQGSVAEVLSFIAQRMKGRKETAKSRIAIQTMLESGRPIVLPEGQSSYMRAKYARALSVGTKQEYKDCAANYAARAESTKEIEDQAHQLQEELQRKQEMLLFLGVLRGKAEATCARLAELARLLKVLDDDSMNARAKADASQGGLSVSTSTKANKHQPVDNTRDALGSLQEHHIRLFHLLDISAEASSSHEEKRLRKALAKSLRLPEDDEQVDGAYEKCLRIANRRALENLRYCSPFPVSDNPQGTEGLDEKRTRVVAKEGSVQRLSDQTLALGVSSAQALQTILTFAETTAPELREQLDEQTRLSQSYVGALQLSVVDKMQPGRGQHGSEVSHGKNWPAVLDSIQNKLIQLHDLESFTQRVQLSSPSVSNEHENHLTIYRQDRAATDESITKLLTRKLEKARAGDVLVRDIESLVKEVEAVAELAGSSDKNRLRS